MKKLFTLFALSFALVTAANATKYTLSNGSFNIASLNLKDGDTLEIPTAGNVTMSASTTISARIVFNIYGNLNITGSNKTLSLSSNSSIINLYPLGSISGTSNSITIGSNQVFNGTAITNNTNAVMTANGLTNGFGGGGTPLPLHFVSFDARLSASTVVLNWSAVNDGPNGLFTIQLSTDGKSWNEVATEAAQGEDHQTISYSQELEAPKGTKIAIYRIAYTSTTGEVIYTQARSLSLNNTVVAAEPVVSVVAANNNIQVRISGVAQDGQTRLFVTSLGGQIISNQTLSADGVVNIAVPASGMYIVTTTDNHSFKNSQKVVLN